MRRAPYVITAYDADGFESGLKTCPGSDPEVVRSRLPRRARWVTARVTFRGLSGRASDGRVLHSGDVESTWERGEDGAWVRR